MTCVQSVRALEILDSRGTPTIAVTVGLSDGSFGSAQVPSGASTGKHEALELRDGDSLRFEGKGVLRAVENVERVIAPSIHGFSIDDQAALDRHLIHLDGTPGKSALGANAILGVSCAFARAAAQSKRLPLWTSLGEGFHPALPVPMINIISGGLHAGGRIEIQDFLIIPHGWQSMIEKLEASVAVHRATRHTLEARGYPLTGVADEGGWGPALPRNESALEVLSQVIAQLGFEKKMSIAIDAAASHFFRGGSYHLTSESRQFTSPGMIDLLAGWVERFPVTSIEDGLDQDDWDGWVQLTSRLGARVQLIGDDLFATNPGRLRHGIALHAANAVLVKMNQIGTLTETMDVVRTAAEGGYRAIISARSGETEDAFLADLATATGAGQIKIGSVTRSERLAKYNRLLEIEREIVPKIFNDFSDTSRL